MIISGLQETYRQATLVDVFLKQRPKAKNKPTAEQIRAVTWVLNNYLALNKPPAPSVSFS